MHFDLARASDAPRIAELAAATSAGFDPTAELARDYARLWVARREDGDARAVAFALVWRAADELHLLDLVVDPAERRKGVGRSLLGHALAAAAAEGASVVLLEVRVSNVAAIGLYRSAGFVESGVRRAYYSDNGEDALLMRLELRMVPSPPTGS